MIRVIAWLLAAQGVVWVGPAVAEAPCTVIRGAAKVWNGQRFLAAASVVLSGKTIAKVGGEEPAGCDVVDATGGVVTPGLIDPYTTVGLTEISLVRTSADTDLARKTRGANATVRAAVRAGFAFNGRSAVIPVTRLGGVTSVVSVPTGGVVSGRALWADLTGGSQDAAIQRDDVAMIATVAGSRGGSRASSFHVIGTALDEVALLLKRRRAWERNALRPLVTPAQDLEALIPVASGARPLVVRVDRASDIEGLLRLLAGTEVKLVIAGGAEAWLVAPALAERGVPVIVDPLRFAAGSLDQVHARPDNIARLHEAGVTVLISTFSNHGVRKLRQLAGNAVREGLPYDVALTAITEGPAQALQMAEHGRIAPGAIANVAVWTGDPLELSSDLGALFIHGKRIPLTSRQTVLRDKYRRVPLTR